MTVIKPVIITIKFNLSSCVGPYLVYARAAYYGGRKVIAQRQSQNIAHHRHLVVSWQSHAEVSATTLLLTFKACCDGWNAFNICSVKDETCWSWMTCTCRFAIHLFRNKPQNCVLASAEIVRNCISQHLPEIDK